jgi:hypothetical protein
LVISSGIRRTEPSRIPLCWKTRFYIFKNKLGPILSKMPIMEESNALAILVALKGARKRLEFKKRIFSHQRVDALGIADSTLIASVAVLYLIRTSKESIRLDDT